MNFSSLRNLFSEILPAPVFRSLLWFVLFFRYSVNHFVEQRGMQTASSLAYTTLLSLVPLLTVMFGFLGGMPVFKELSGDIQSFIFNNFVPSFGYSVQNYLFEFSQKASKLTFTGTAVLILIALMLMATIDNAFNKIWNVKTKRNPLARFLVYWAILTLGPLLVGVGLLSTSYLLALPAFDELYPSLGIKVKLLRMMPFLTTSIAFSLLYLLIPNCLVPKKNALIGGIIAAFLFEMAKFGFGVYVKAMPSYEAIYGAIAVIPIFLLWIYLSWVIVILGAHLSYCLSNFQLDSEGNQYGHKAWDFVDVYKIIAMLWEAQKKGSSLSVRELKKLGIALTQGQIAEILFVLTKASWVSRSASGKYLLSRDLSETKVKDLHSLLPCKFFNDDPAYPADAWEATLETLLKQYELATNEVLDVPLRDLLTKISD